MITHKLTQLVSIAFFIIISQNSWGCACISKPGVDLVRDAKSAFVVRVKTEYSKVRLNVTKVYRGDVPPNIDITFRILNASDCDKPISGFRDGKSYLWLTNKSGDDFKKIPFMHECSFFKEVENAQDELKFLESETRKKKKPAKTKDV
jgi:hypothetical protein